MRLRTLLPAVWLGLAQLLPWPLDFHLPPWAARALHNPRERTAEGIRAYQGEDYAAAAEAMDAALRLGRPLTGDAEPDPLAGFNAGTAHLAAGEAKRATELLDAAIATAGERSGPPPGLASPLHYNLGNAKLAGDDLPGAIQAYEEALRRDPANADAKFNLEVALARLEEQKKMPLKKPQPTPGGDRQGDREQGDRGGADQPSDRPREDAEAADRGRGDEDRGPEEGRDQQPPTEGGPQGTGQQRPLPRFEDQPDMTAEQAAALLESVENLERRQRQQQAVERARREARGKKDW